MDVTLTSAAIPYLDKSTIEEYSNLKFYSEKGEVVKMNPVILAALQSTLVKSLTDADYEDCCFITEFAKSELNEINEFVWTGKCKRSIVNNIFIALGIDLDYFGKLSEIDIGASLKLEVKEEEENENEEKYLMEDNIDYFEDIPLTEFKQPRIKRKYKKRPKSEDELDENWTPHNTSTNKIISKKKVKKEKKDDKGAANFNDEHKAIFESFELPKALESYKMPSFESRNIDIGCRVIDYTKEFCCELCSSRFLTSGNLEHHITKCHFEHFDCTYCKRSFKLDQADKFKLHMFKHEHNLINTTASTCVQCGKYFRFGSQYQEHIKLKGEFHDDQCAQCNDKFATYEEYQSHVQAIHLGVWKYKCGFCQTLFDETRLLKSHISYTHLGKVRKIRTSTKKIKTESFDKVCEECGKNVRDLTGHIMQVHQDLKLPCPHCPILSKNPAKLKRHIEWVHMQMPCLECGEMVGRRKMPRHVASKHTSIYDRKFKCDVCGKGFNDKAKLSDHNNVHTGEKPFKCKFCNACFASRGTHAMHQRSHLGHRRSK